MGRRVDIDNLIGTDGAREILGLSRKSSVNTYIHRHPDFPPPLKKLSARCPIWDRRDIERWVKGRGRTK